MTIQDLGGLEWDLRTFPAFDLFVDFWRANSAVYLSSNGICGNLVGLPTLYGSVWGIFKYCRCS